MSKFKYIVTDISSENATSVVTEQESLNIPAYSVNSLFTENKHYIQVNFKTFDNVVLKSDNNYKGYSQLLNAAGAGKEGASNISVDPIKDLKAYGYEGVDILVEYNFKNTLFTEQKFGGLFFVESKSPDGTEVRLLPLFDDNTLIAETVDTLSDKINNQKSFSEFFVNGKVEEAGLNIATETTDKGLAVVLKLKNSTQFNINDQVTLNEKVSDTVTYKVEAELVPEQENLRTLKGPNFSPGDLSNDSVNTEYLNYNELFSYPVTGSYYELYSLFNDNSAQISINHEDYKDFVHYSSAEERLRNFKYKLDLIHSYEDSIASASLSNRNLLGISGSRDYYEGLIKGIVNNFDHYDRFLYYESGSSSWPKNSTVKPHTNYRSGTSQADTWFNGQIVSASNYDVSNFDILTNTIPTFIREDVNNEPYLMFIHMIAQHFDNLWIYFKAVSDKYDTDNRLNFGISKDLVKDAIESLGYNLYNSNASLENLFSAFIGESYQSGSEQISNVITALSGSSNSYLQPVSKDTYTKEIYKRIYHNIPFLTKTKGTQRGLRALITCFGIPESILHIRTAPGSILTDDEQFNHELDSTSSFDSIRTDNTGTEISGSTLSKYTSIFKPSTKYGKGTHEISIGFNVSQATNKRIQAITTGSFNVDEYIGDPRDLNKLEYRALDIYAEELLTGDSISWQDIQSLWENSEFEWDTELTYYRTPFAFVRLMKFFDNSLFKMIKDFLPARTTASTGLIIEPHILTRNKVKSVDVSFEEKQYSGSIGMYAITGSDGDTFPFAASQSYTTNYSASFVTPLGKIEKNVTDESPRITGEFSGSFIVNTDGELTRDNPFRKSGQPLITNDISTFFLSDPLPPLCRLSLVAEYEGDYYTFSPQFVGGGTGTIQIEYPEPSTLYSASFNYVHDFDDYQYFTVKAEATYYPGGTFEGWYRDAAMNELIQTDPLLTIYSISEQTHGTNTYYAKFNA